MVVIGITGIASTLARAVVPRLLQEPSIEKIIGVDIRPPEGLSNNRLEFHRVDVRDLVGLKVVFQKIDVLLHLAFIVFENLPDRKTIDAINIQGSKNAFIAAAEGGACKIIHMSSVAAYGMTRETPPLITEETPLRGAQNTTFYYPYTKALVEDYLDQFQKDHPQICITRFRPHIIVGPQFAAHTTHLKVLLSGISKGNTILNLKPLNAVRMNKQLTHEADLVEAITMAVFRHLPGAYNIAAQPLELEEYLLKKNQAIRFLPWIAVNFMLGLGSLFSKRVRNLKSWALGMKYQITVCSDKIEHAGLVFKYPTTESCIAAFLSEK